MLKVSRFPFLVSVLGLPVFWKNFATDVFIGIFQDGQGHYFEKPLESGARSINYH